ncbi:hypothetical protein B566_EDAN008846 [Ephemera danica]|nr:hypothetical protein B566_EDAN008846 [Ephemera danica]
MASRLSTKPNLTLEAATRRSHARASSKPPPNAAPSIAAITGMGNLSTEAVRERSPQTKSLTSELLIPARSLRSAPAQNTPGTKLRKINTRMLLSVLTSCMQSRKDVSLQVSVQNAAVVAVVRWYHVPCTLHGPGSPVTYSREWTQKYSHVISANC